MHRLLLFLASVLLTAGLGAQTVTINDDSLRGDTDYTWTADNEYLLDGLVYLEEGATLSIEAGTVVRGKVAPSTGDNTSALIITRGARILAEGTAEAPVIFTAEGDDVTDPVDFLSIDRGEWGGLIVLGRAPVTRPGGEDGVEGIDADEDRARFGGTAENDNSGVLRYVSIRHGGAVLANNSEINGLTLGGVGSGTVVDYVEVYANEDDGIELFGGTVTVTHATVAFCGDDAFDWDFGWRGAGQFWFSLQGANRTGTGRAGEHDGAKPDGLLPESDPILYNVTFIGVGQDATTGEIGSGDATDNPAFALLFRDNSAGNYNNSIFYDFNGAAVAIEDRDDTDDGDSYARFENGDLRFVDNIFHRFGAGTAATDIFLAVTADEAINPTSSAVVAERFLTNDNRLTDPQLNGTDRTTEGGLDPRPAPGGTAASGAVPIVDAEVLEPVRYYGAFAPGNGDDNPAWVLGWTAVADALDVGVISSLGETTAANGYRLGAPVPNPASTHTTIDFELPRAATVRLTVLDLLGRPVYGTTAYRPAGTHRQDLPLDRLRAGNYLIVLQAGGNRLLRRLSVGR